MKNDKRVRKGLGSIERDLLNELSAGDMLVGMFLSARSSKAMFKTARARSIRRQTMKRAVERLIQKGFVIQTADTLCIAPAGLRVLERAISDMRLKLHTPHRWDKKWRLIIFDIPERFRQGRDALRLVLKRAGFVQLQQSAWVHPFDCEDLERLLKQDSRLKDGIIYALVERLSEEQILLKHFGLTRK